MCILPPANLNFLSSWLGLEIRALPVPDWIWATEPCFILTLVVYKDSVPLATLEVSDLVSVANPPTLKSEVTAC